MMRHGPTPARDAGFTLMEAIVAMVLIGGVGMALAGWLNTNLTTLSRVQQANARADAKMNVLEYMEKVNPMQTPVGDADFGVYKIHWQAQANAGPLDDTGYPRGKGLYQIALYDTSVKVMASNGQNWFDFQVQQVGYKQVRTQSFDE